MLNDALERHDFGNNLEKNVFHGASVRNNGFFSLRASKNITAFKMTHNDSLFKTTNDEG